MCVCPKLVSAADLEKGLQLSKVEVGVEAGGLVPDGALLGGLDLVPVQLLQLAPLACCRPHLHHTSPHKSVISDLLHEVGLLLLINPIVVSAKDAEV